MVNIGSAIAGVFGPVGSFLGTVLGTLFVLVLVSLVAVFGFFFVRYKFDPLHLEVDELRKPYIKLKYYDLFRWLLVDFLERGKHVGEFLEYGFTFFVGRQGAGKTASMVRYLELMKAKYPNCLIITNFGYYQADAHMKDWRDVMRIRNGTDGVIFAIDEIHSEYSSAAWKDVPEDLLSEISQQRKQRVKIVATAQFYSRVAKPLREQAMTVVTCRTFLHRLTKNREYDAIEYQMLLENPVLSKRRLKPLRKSSFVQSDAFRECYDTYEKIERMQKINFIPRSQRGTV